MDAAVITCAVYLALTVAAAVWVARFAKGRRFLVDVFRGNRELALPVLELLGVGFFVIRALLFVVVVLAPVCGVIYLLVKLVNLLGGSAPGADGRGDV